jgi:hypothetical protein
MSDKTLAAAEMLTGRDRWRRAALGALLACVLACDIDERRRQQGALEWTAERTQMVDEQLRARDISSPRVLDAMRRVPRHLFVPQPDRAHAYRDAPLPIGHGQTISQPYICLYTHLTLPTNSLV